MIENKIIVAGLVEYIERLGLTDDVVAELSSRAALASDRLRTDLRVIIREELAAPSERRINALLESGLAYFAAWSEVIAAYIEPAM